MGSITGNYENFQIDNVQDTGVGSPQRFFPDM